MSSYELTGQFKNRGQRTGQKEGGGERGRKTGDEIWETGDKN